MAKDKQNLLYYFLASTLILAGVGGGGYFCCVSILMSVILLSVIVYILEKSGSFFIAYDINLAAVASLAAGYFLTSLWAVDSWRSQAVSNFCRFFYFSSSYVSRWRAEKS